jgi:ribosomal protein S18 acetylase RimI-like enzyme
MRWINMAMKIRRIYSSEGDLVADLFDRYRMFYQQPSDPVLARNYILTRLENNESVIFVALVEGTPVGFTQLYPCYSSIRAAQNWILNDLYVDRVYRKLKIGEALMQTAIDFARQEGATFMELETATDNIVAQGLYEKMGFIRQQPASGFYTYRISITD